MTSRILPFLLFLIASGCKKKLSRDCTEDVYNCFFYPASVVDTANTAGGITYAIKPGNQIVFQYTHIGPDCKSLADEEYVEYLVFQIPNAISSFRYENNELANQITVYKRNCYCLLRSALITRGFVQGSRLSSDRWVVEIQAEVPGWGLTIHQRKIFLRKH